jgi:hypothetical protein
MLYVPLKAPRDQLSQQQHSEQEGREQQHVQQLSGLLLVGSKCSSSQVVGITQQLWNVATGSVEQVLQQQQQQQSIRVPILQSALSPSLAGAQSVAVYQDPTGEACACRLTQAAHMSAS